MTYTCAVQRLAPPNLIMVSGFGTQWSDSIIINVNPYLSVCLLEAEASAVVLVAFS